MGMEDLVKGVVGIPIAMGKEIISNPIGFVADNMLGVDDFRRAVRYGGEGSFGKMLKSLGAGGFELGSTLLPAGALISGAKAGAVLPVSRKILGRELPAVSSRILGAIPGATAAVEGGRALTPGAIRALQALRAGENLQWLDMGNAMSGMFGGPSAPIGSARQVADEIRKQQGATAFADVLSQLRGQPSLPTAGLL